MPTLHPELTSRGYLPAGTDVAATVREGDEHALHAVWATFHEIQFIRERLLPVLDADPAKAEAASHTRAELAGLADVSALQALAANQRLVELLTGRRWMTMQAAREAGASWAAVGEALNMTKQGAMDWYKRKIELQEQHVPEFHNAERARAALSGDSE